MPTKNVLIKVTKIAMVKILPKLLKNFFYFIFNEDSKIIGGNKIIIKKLLNDFCISFKAPL